jgi:hypothetical protein
LLPDLDRQELWGEFDAEQQKAMRWLLYGDNPTYAAKHSGVPRSNIYRWLKHLRFSAVFQLLKHYALADNRECLHLLSGRAVRTLADALDKGDARIALQLVKHLGMLGRRE